MGCDLVTGDLLRVSFCEDLEVGDRKVAASLMPMDREDDGMGMWIDVKAGVVTKGACIGGGVEACNTVLCPD